MAITPGNNIEKLIDVFAQQIQDLETVYFELLLNRLLDTAVGAQLDVIGRIVGLARSAFTDDEYRDRLRGQILLNLASGELPKILEMVEIIVGDAVPLNFVEEFPAAFEIRSSTVPLPAGQGVTVAALVKDAKGGGIKGLFRFFETSPVFRFDGADGTKFDGGSFFATSL